ncbi:MAG TPA: hypothetical protein VJ579_01785 [Candidatus Paceibacterota bacterium]|nr:hypothetical protein [Candidatus Paceibacterota bacterium]
MLSSLRRIQRADFPDSRLPSFQWTGKVLRVRAIHKRGERARIAIIAAKKYYRTKITRNVFKRRVFSLLRDELPKLDTTPFGFFLVFPVVHTQDITFAAIASDLKEFLEVLHKQHAH